MLVVTMLRRGVTTGVQTHVLQVADLLAARGFRVRVIRPADGAVVLGSVLAILLRVPGRVGSEAGVRLDRYLHRKLAERALRGQVRRELPAAVYAQDPRSAQAALDARGSLDIPVTMVVHYNESQADELAQRGLVSRGGRTYRSVLEKERDVLPRLDGLVFVSDFMRSSLYDDVPRARAVPSAIIPNFLEDHEQDGLDGADVSKRDCISVGSLSDRKNHAYLLRVLAAARERGHRYTLTIVGDGPQREPLQRLTEELGLTDQVLLTGPRRDVADLLLRHRVYVHSAEMDNLPYAVIEALRAGLPVLAGRVGGIPEVVGPAGAGAFWDLSDPAAGAEVLTALLEDSGRLAAAAAQAARRFTDTFSADVAGRRLVDFLGTVRRSQVAGAPTELR